MVFFYKLHIYIQSTFMYRLYDLWAYARCVMLHDHAIVVYARTVDCINHVRHMNMYDYERNNLR